MVIVCAFVPVFPCPTVQPCSVAWYTHNAQIGLMTCSPLRVVQSRYVLYRYCLADDYS